MTPRPASDKDCSDMSVEQGTEEPLIVLPVPVHEGDFETLIDRDSRDVYHRQFLNGDWNEWKLYEPTPGNELNEI